MRIGGRAIGPGQRPLRLAAAGTAHEGDVQLGYKLVETAGATGAEAVVLGRGALTDRDFTCVLGHAGHVGLTAVGVVTGEEDLALLDALDVPALRMIADSDATPLLVSAARTGRPLLLSLLRPRLEEVEPLITVCRQAGASAFALLAPDLSMMEAWQATWPGTPIGLLGGGLSPDEPRASHAALIETEHRLPVSSVPRRNPS